MYLQMCSWARMLCYYTYRTVIVLDRLSISWISGRQNKIFLLPALFLSLNVQVEHIFVLELYMAWVKLTKCYEICIFQHKLSYLEMQKYGMQVEQYTLFMGKHDFRLFGLFSCVQMFPTHSKCLDYLLIYRIKVGNLQKKHLTNEVVDLRDNKSDIPWD